MVSQTCSPGVVPFGTGNQDCACTTELAETAPIVVDCQGKVLSNPIGKGRRTRSRRPSGASLVQRALGRELDPGKMPLNLCGLATGLFPKGKNLYRFSHQIVCGNSGKLGSPGLSPIKLKTPCRLFLYISASCFRSSQEQVTLAGL